MENENENNVNQPEITNETIVENQTAPVQEPPRTNYENNTTNTSSTNPSTTSTTGFSIASLILGIISIFAAFVAIFGYITSITGLVLGIVGRKKDKSTLSIVGIVFSSLGIAASLLSSLIGVITMLALL